MIELHGKALYKIVLIHGGPGAIGSLKNCAEELSELTGKGIIEALQTRYSIDGLIEELYLQIMEYRQEKTTLIDHTATDEDVKKIPGILEKSDNYHLESKGVLTVYKADSEMYNRIWDEAVKLRISGELLKAFKNIQGEMFLIQGVCDPHPIEGVVKPLEENGISCKTYILEKCRHSPFMEKYAKEKFYDILQTII